MKQDPHQLASRLDYSFADIALLELALTHRSYQKGLKSNERLEFLGDSILNFVVAKALFEKLPKANEGELSRMRSNIVNRATLAKIARQYQVGDYLMLGLGERKTGGFRRDSTLADAVEAIIGAVFLDAGFAACEQCILRWFAESIEEASVSKVNKDAKTILQEKLQSARLDLPHYELLTETGQDHNKLFLVSCEIPALKISTKAQGKNLRMAQQQAAELALIEMSKK